MRRSRRSRGSSLKPSKAANKERGDIGEEAAAGYLSGRGYRIAERKFRCRSGEIDIIAFDGHTLVFVEVRSRSGTDHGLPVETIGREKRRRIIRTATAFQLRHGFFDADCRFDCVSVLFDGQGKVTDIELIKDAFWS